jgi:type I restriction enzyme M protein
VDIPLGVSEDELSQADGAEDGAPGGDDRIEDFFKDGELLKRTPVEEVRQRIAQALEYEYHLLREDMEREFPVRVVDTEGKKRLKRAGIAIFERGQPHTIEHLRRVVICRPEPRNGARGVPRIRDHEQADKELGELWELMQAVPSCEHGLWTNGLDLFFLRKERSRFEDRPKAGIDWPPAEEYVATELVESEIRLRQADPYMLRTAFRRCHNFIHGNEGMPKDAAFWQFLYLIFAKMYDERHHRDDRRFYALPTEPFTESGQRAVRSRVQPLFDAVKREYGSRSDNPIFTGSEQITLSDRALAFLVSELARYDFTRTKIDAKGAAYQELVGTNLRGDRGQYFTPRKAIDLMVSILDPKEDEKVFDPACGTGGFLQATLTHLLSRWRAEERVGSRPDLVEDLRRYVDRLQRFTDHNLFGADFDPFLVRAASMALLMMAGTAGNVYQMDSLAFPKGHLQGLERAKEHLPEMSVDVLMTNPPFGSDISVTDPMVLESYRGVDGVARQWRRPKGGELVAGEGMLTAVAPEVLFIQKAIGWLRPGGRLGIVLPNGLLSNPGPADEGVRRWIMSHCWVLASIELPVETFIVEANVNIFTTLLFLKRKTEAEMNSERLRGSMDYPVFMAVAEKVGFDRRGNRIYRRGPDGEEIWVEGNGEDGASGRRRRRRRRVEDDDLPAIANAYREFRQLHPEPGLTGTIV